MDNIAMPSTVARANGPVYRNPLRNDLHDEQTLMDRTSIPRSNTYESTDNFPMCANTSTRHMRQPNQYGMDGTRRSTITIPPYDGKDEKVSVSDFFRLYERMSNANQWDSSDRFNLLYFNLIEEPQRYCDTLLKDGYSNYEALMKLNC